MHNVTDDKETDHATQKCVAVGGIACAGVIPPSNIYYSGYAKSGFR